MVHEEAAWLTHLPTFYSNILIATSDSSGLAADQINLVFILITCASCGLIYRNIPNVLLKHIFGASIGYLSCWALYGTRETLLLVGFILFMYPVVIYIRRPWLTFWITHIVLFSAMVYMSVYHYLSWRLDATTSLMGIVIRLQMISWDLVDGEQLKRSNILSQRKSANLYRLAHACSRNPTFVEYFCYMLFFCHALCGSNITIKEYLEISDNTIYSRNGYRKDPKKSNIDSNGKPIITKDVPPLNLKVFTWRLTQIIAVAITFMLGKIYVPESFLYSENFASASILYRLGYLPLCSFLMKFKYHFGWKFLDLCNLTSGVAFNYISYDDNGKIISSDYSRGQNINSRKTAFPTSTADIVRNWNITVNTWLTQYVFQRITVPKFLLPIFGDKGGKIVITRLTGALFHGLYPGYWIFFGYTAIVTIFIDNLRLLLPTEKTFQDTNKALSYIFRLLWIIFIVWQVDAAGFTFMQNDIVKAMRINSLTAFYPFVLALGGMIATNSVLASHRRARKKAEKNKKTE